MWLEQWNWLCFLLLFCFSDDEGVYHDDQLEFDTGFGNIIVVDNLPVVPKTKFEKLENVLKKIYSQLGVIKERGLWMPVDPNTGTTLGYCFIEFNTPQVCLLCNDVKANVCFFFLFFWSKIFCLDMLGFGFCRKLKTLRRRLMATSWTSLISLLWTCSMISTGSWMSRRSGRLLRPSPMSLGYVLFFFFHHVNV